MNSTIEDTFNALQEVISFEQVDCTILANYISSKDSLTYARDFWLNSISNESQKLLPNEYDFLLSGSNWLEFAEWSMQFGSKENVEMLNRTILSGRCARTICRVIEWRGNQDINGVGAVATYFVLASLTTLFTLFGFRYHSLQQVAKNRILYSLYKIIPIFNETTLFLCLGLSFAALKTSADTISLNELHTIPYISAFALLCHLATVVRDRSKMDSNIRHALGTRDGVVLCIFGFLLFIVSGTVSNNRLQELRDLNQVSHLPQWDSHCFSHIIPSHYMRSYLISFIILFGIIFLTGFTTLLPIPWKFIFQWDILCACVSLGMWALLGLVMVHRRRVHEWSGAADEEEQWGFGQVVALAAWLNVVVHFYASYRYGWYKREEELKDEEWRKEQQAAGRR